MASDGKLRQAVIVIHGIGEQKPMTTLRRFTHGVVEPVDSKPGYASHPDRYSGSMELFAHRVPPESANRETPITDFFECHWAHRMRDTELRHVWTWLWRLIKTRPKRTARVYPIYLVALALIGVFALIFAVVGLRYPWNTTWEPALGAAVSIGAAGVGIVLRTYVGGFLGDAARYLTPSPDNFAERAAIRDQAVKLLTRLHRSKKYQRIVVVGHSLGSVIAYDVLARFWDDYREELNDNAAEQRVLCELEKLGHDMHEARRAMENAEEREEKLRWSMSGDGHSEVEECQRRLEELGREYREKQILLWKEQRHIGNPWLITDLITLGSPLAHAEYLMKAAGDQEWGLKESALAREMPRCPPLNDNWNRKSGQHWPADQESAIAYSRLGKEGKRVIVPFAQFAFVRWTNLYFPGDLVGGPVARSFGFGIKDVRVWRVGKDGFLDRLVNWLPSSHTKYWEPDDSGGIKETGGANRFPRGNHDQAKAIDELRKALALTDKDTDALLREMANV